MRPSPRAVIPRPDATLVSCAALGTFLMCTPLAFGTKAPLYFSNHIDGCLIILVSVTAMAEIARSHRFLNIALSAWFAISPIVYEGAVSFGAPGDVVIGVLVVVMSLLRGERSGEHYGGWNRLIV